MSASQAERRGFDPRLPLHFMQVWVYILFSEKLGRHYVGITNDLSRRLTQHRKGQSHWSSRADDWLMVYSHQFDSMPSARQMEMTIKARGAKRFILDAHASQSRQSAGQG